MFHGQLRHDLLTSAHTFADAFKHLPVAERILDPVMSLPGNRFTA